MQMRNFSTALRLLIDEKEIQPAKIARKAGIAESILCRVLGGKQKAITIKNAEAIIRFFGRPEDRVLLTKAFAEDHLIGPVGKDLVVCRRFVPKSC